MWSSSHNKNRIWKWHGQCLAVGTILYFHSSKFLLASKINNLRSSLNFEQMLQNLLYLYKKKTQVVFSFFISSNFQFSLMNDLVHVDISQGIHKVKIKVTWNEKWKKLLGFSFYMNIGNFEAFLPNLNLSSKHLFWRYVKYWEGHFL